jgi:hypothetical protein
MTSGRIVEHESRVKRTTWGCCNCSMLFLQCSRPASDLCNCFHMRDEELGGELLPSSSWLHDMWSEASEFRSKLGMEIAWGVCLGEATI